MAQHSVLTIKNALVSLDGTEFGDAITAVTLNVAFETSEWIPVSGAVQSSVGEPRHTLNLDFGQSFVNGELLHKLYTEHGEKVPFSIRPEGGTTPSIVGTLTLTAPSSIMGAVGVATTTAVLPVDSTGLVITWATA